jgi:hypothetical protein
MVDPRIYRAAWVIVFVALVVFGFSLRDGPSGASTDLSPGGASFHTAFLSAEALAEQFGVVSPGSAADDQEAGLVAASLRKVSGFTVTTRNVPTRTVDGEQAIETVEAERPGLGSGTVVVIANRDGAAPVTAGVHGTFTTTPGSAERVTATSSTIAANASTAVLEDLAVGLSGSALNRSVMFISTSGSVGAAGATQVARQLAGTNVDAVIVLGDLAAETGRRPVVVPWSSTSALASPTLVATLDRALSSQAQIKSGYPSFSSELAQLAFPFATGSEAPFAGAGIPAAGLSLSGDRVVGGSEPVGSQRLAKMGMAVEEAVDALDSGAAVPASGAYLTVSSQVLPLWAFRLLVLGFIAPIAIGLVDALARARRRGHSVLSWIVWVFSGIAPFVVGLIVIRAAGLGHVISAPAGAVAHGDAPTVGAVAAVVLAVLAIGVSFRLLRPLGVQIATSIGWRRTPTSPVIEGATVALSIVLCALTLVVWVFNPFAAALLVPALHVWLWIGSPGVVRSRVRVSVLLLGGLILPALVAVYYMVALGLSPWAFAWSVTLAVAGGTVSIATALSWCVSLGVLAGSLVLVLRASRAVQAEVDAPVTVRGPVGYAGPGSLGGTSSALRR